MLQTGNAQSNTSLPTYTWAEQFRSRQGNQVHDKRLSKKLKLSVFTHSLIAQDNSVEEKNDKSKSLPKDIYRAGHTFLSDFWYVASSPARISWKSAFWLGGLTVASGFIYANDQEILDALRRNRDFFIYKPFLKLGENFKNVGHMGITNKYYFAALALSYILNIETVTIITAQILESHFIAGGFKNLANVLVGRARPFEGKGPRSYSFNDGTSFPSGHASNIFQMVTVLAHHIQFLPFQIFAYSIAAGVSFERIDTKNHWPSDVFIAAVFGTAISRAVLKLHEERKLRVVPQISENVIGMSINISMD